MSNSKEGKSVSVPIVITIPHHLGKDEAIRRMKNGLSSAKLPLVTIDKEVWNGDQLEFGLSAMGQQASGTAQVLEDGVRLTLTLPWLLQRFADLAGGALAARTKLLLEKK